MSSDSPDNLATIWQPVKYRWKSAGLYLIVLTKVYPHINASKIGIKSLEKGKNNHWERKMKCSFLVNMKEWANIRNIIHTG